MVQPKGKVFIEFGVRLGMGLAEGPWGAEGAQAAGPVVVRHPLSRGNGLLD